MGRNWAIVIGINKYYSLTPLRYAKADAEAIKDWFEKEARFDRVFQFTEDSAAIAASPQPIPTQPTFANVCGFLESQFERPLLNPEDNLWFFFAGHGRRYKDQDYLMFLDSAPTLVDRTAISVDYITQRLRRCGADNVVLLLDACRDEGSRGGLGIGEDEHQGVVTFYSCNANQRSWEIDELQHGAFTFALLEGLRLQGEANCATVERLNQYLSYYVPQLNQRYRKPSQSPYLRAEPPRKMYYILLDQVATLKDAEPLKYQASQAENRGDWLLAKQLWKRILALPGVDEDAWEAIERITQRQSTVFNNASRSEPATSSTGERGKISDSAQREVQRLRQQQEMERQQRQGTQRGKKQFIDLHHTQTLINRRQFFKWARWVGLGIVGAGSLITIVFKRFLITPKITDIKGRTLTASTKDKSSQISALSYVSYSLKQKFGPNIENKVQVQTTIDADFQRIAEETINKWLTRLEAQGLDKSQIALVAIDPSTHFIKALIGRAYSSENLETINQQVGSALKPFVYYAAFATGKYAPDSTVVDSPVSYRDGDGWYYPKNYDGGFSGAMSIRSALAQLRNIPVIKIGKAIGMNKVVKTCRALGIMSPMEPVTSLPLGAISVTPLEMASAYATLANYGWQSPSTIIMRVTDSSGNVLLDNTPKPKLVLDPWASASIIDAMSSVITEGPGKSAAIGRPAAGMIGTTEEKKDIWFVGTVPQLTTAVWIGLKDGKSKNDTSDNLAAMIWSDFMQETLKGFPIESFKDISQFKRPSTN